MEGVLLTAALLACPVGMGLMMWFSSRAARGSEARRRAASLEELRREHAWMSAEIEQYEARLAEFDLDRAGADGGGPEAAPVSLSRRGRGRDGPA
jgi:hypothetical protein